VRRVGTVVVTLVGLLALTQAVSLLSVPASLFAVSRDAPFTPPAPLELLGTCIPALVAVLAGVVLVGYRKQIATRLFDDAPDRVDLDSSALLRIGLALVGVFTVAQALPWLVASLVSVVSDTTSRNQLGDVVPWTVVALQDLPQLVARLGGVIVGFALLAKAGLVAGWLTPSEPGDGA
jgi:hypothetical protein